MVDARGVCELASGGARVAGYYPRAWVHPKVTSFNRPVVRVFDPYGYLLDSAVADKHTIGKVACRCPSILLTCFPKKGRAFFVDLCMEADRLEEEGE